MSKDLVSRVKDLLLSPKAEWDTIDSETVEPAKLVTSYVAPLAAIPAIATVIGFGVFGFGPFKMGFGSALTMGVTQFVMAILAVFVFAFVINALAPNFGAEKNFNQAFKVTAYSPTASWVAGIFVIFPLLGVLALVGAVYSLYLLFVGLPKVMKPAADKATTYTIVSILVAIVVWVVISFVANMFVPRPGVGDLYSSSQSSSEMARNAQAMEEAAESGDINQMMNAAANMMGVSANAAVVDSEALRALAPQRISGLNRDSLNIESISAPVKAVIMEASYSNGDKHLEVRVTNSPMMSAMMGVAGFTGAEYNRTNDDGYERLTKKGDVMIIEEWSKSANRGRYGRTVEGGFLVEAEGDGVSMKDLEKAVNDFSKSKLNALPKAS